MANLFFDLPDQQHAEDSPTLWLKGAAVLTIGYITFALILIGVKAFSRGAVVIALLSLCWVLFGMITQKIKLPRILLLPVAFYVYTLFSGLYLEVYPVEYLGTLTTIWVGAITLAIFVANGVSINLVLAGFIVLTVVNFAAVAVGYDGHLINYGGENMDSLQSIDIQRYSALAGQSNKLVALVFTLPFLLFLTKKKVGFAIYVLAIAIAVVTTVLSGSRSAIALTVLFTLTGAVWLIGSSTLRTMAILAGAGGALAIVIFFNSDGALSRIEHSRFGEEVVVKRALQAIDGNHGESGDLRKQFIEDSWQYFGQKPFIGHGPNSFATVSGSGTYAHNNFAEISVNWGIIGLLLYYSMYLATLARIGQKMGHRVPMVATLLFLMLSDLWFVTFVNRSMVLCLCLLMITVFATNRSSSRSSKRRRRRRRSRTESPVLPPTSDPFFAKSGPISAKSDPVLAKSDLTLAEQHDIDIKF